MLPGKNEKLANARLFSKYKAIFSCPICMNPMKVINAKSFFCPNHHCFDIAKKGYVNFLTRSQQTKYGKNMFESRRRMHAHGYFEPLVTRICENMIRELKPAKQRICILDAGCGEGSHLSDIQQKLREQTKLDPLGVGIDIAKEGIVIASRGASNILWCVADLANPPFADYPFDFILNILSPSNYSAFQRMLKDDGMVIKVIPECHYLQQIRAIFYKQSNRELYSNKQTIELFRQHFDLVDIQRIQYNATLDHDDMESLVHMTPLSWGASEETKEQVLSLNNTEITFDFAILLGKK